MRRLSQVALRAVMCTLAAFLVGAFSAPAHADDVTTIQFSSVGGITDAPLYSADEYGLFAKAGLKVERQRMSSAPNLMTVVATGQVDVAGISMTPGLARNSPARPNSRMLL